MNLKRYLLSLLLILNIVTAFARPMLGKSISVHFNQIPVSRALDLIAEKGAFRFSYKSDIFNAMELVSLSADNKPVKQVLDELFQGRYHYSERGSYVIIHAGGEQQFVISGFVKDGYTGAYLSNVTVYEDQVLASAITNDKGYFRLPIKNKRKLKTVSIIARKESYMESYVALNAGCDHMLEMAIVPDSEVQLKDVWVRSANEDMTWASRLLLSSRQKIQNLNIGDFLAKRPFQTSLLPGLGTHRLMGAQVVNKFSLNVLGGYTAGVNGFELGGLFNINKGDVRYFQAAGLFNNTNGSLTGMQTAGIYNWTGAAVRGFQSAGIGNYTKAGVEGFQSAGIANINGGSSLGFQAAGIVNGNRGAYSGFQASGILNQNSAHFRGFQASGVANNEQRLSGVAIAGVANNADSVKGVQISGVINRSRYIKGLQLGLVNVAQSMHGVGIGLVNYYCDGYHKLSVSATELQALNLSWISGSRHFYSVLTAGAGFGASQSYSCGWGMGSRAVLSRRVSLQNELLVQCWYIGTWEYLPITTRAQSNLVYTIARWFELYGGIAYSLAEAKSVHNTPGYISWLQSPEISYHRLSDRISGWAGFQVGVRIL